MTEVIAPAPAGGVKLPFPRQMPAITMAPSPQQPRSSLLEPAAPGSPSSSSLLSPTGSRTKKKVTLALPPSTSPDPGRRKEDGYDFNLFQMLVQKRLPFLRNVLAADARKANCKDADGTPLLHTAVIVSSPEALELLLECGANTNILDGSGRTALHTAVIEGQEKCLEILLRHGSDINATEGRNQRTALHLAVSNDHLEVAEMLIAHGIVVNAEDANGETALQWACKFQKMEFIRMFLKHGANPNAMDVDGMPCLYYCALHGNREALQLLVEAGGNVDIQDNLGTTPLLRACFSGEVDAIRALIECGADMAAVDAEGVSCLHCVVKSKSMLAFDTLWEALPDHLKQREPIDDRGRTPLFWAVTQGDPHSYEIAKKLLELGEADVEAKDSNGVSVLMGAALKGSLDCVKLCTEANAYVNETSNSGMTPLHFACLGGHEECVAHLLEEGADPTIEDEEGQTPLRCAASGGHLGVVQLLNDALGNKGPGTSSKGFSKRTRSFNLTSSVEDESDYGSSSSPRPDDKEPPNPMDDGSLSHLHDEESHGSRSPAPRSRSPSPPHASSALRRSSRVSSREDLSSLSEDKDRIVKMRTANVLTSATVQQDCTCTIQ